MPPYLDHLLHNQFYGNYTIRVVFAIVFSYLMGSIPFKNVTAWFFTGTDHRLESTMRGFVPIMNLVKTLIPVLIVTHGGGAIVGSAATVAAVLGDCFCPWLWFKTGGRGAAATLGALCGLCWPAALVFAIAWLTLAIASNYTTVGTLFSTVFVLLPLWYFLNAPGAWCGLALIVIVGVANSPSFWRLLEGTEPMMRVEKVGFAADEPRPASVVRLSGQPVQSFQI